MLLYVNVLTIVLYLGYIVNEGLPSTVLRVEIKVMMMMMMIMVMMIRLKM